MVSLNVIVKPRYEKALAHWGVGAPQKIMYLEQVYSYHEFQSVVMNEQTDVDS